MANKKDDDNAVMPDKFSSEKAPRHTRYWESKDFNPGRKKRFETPDDLWEAAVKYFKWVDDNPLQEHKVFHSQGMVTKTYEKKLRPMSLQRLCSYINIDYSNYTRYRDREEFASVCETIDGIIRENKFEGAAAGFFNPNIIARDLGLREGVDHTSSDRSMGNVNVVVDEAAINSILDKI